MIEALSFWNILIHYRNQLLLICDKECLTKGMFFRWLGFLLGFFSRIVFGNMLVPLSPFFFVRSVPHLLFYYVGIENSFYSKCGSFLRPPFHHKNSISLDDPDCHEGDISSFTSEDLRRMKL